MVDIWAIASTIAAVASLVVSLVALYVAKSALRKADVNSSASLCLTFHENFRAAWSRLLTQLGGDHQFQELGDLMNTFELACAVQRDGALHGQAGKLLSNYIVQAMEVLTSEKTVLHEIQRLLQDRTTFENIDWFVQASSGVPREFKH